LGLFTIEQKKIKNAIANKKTALRIRKALYFGNHYLIAEALNSVGISYDLLGRKHEELNYFEDALEMMKQLCQETDSIDLIISFYNIGHLYCELKDEKKGNEHLEKGNKMKKILFKFFVIKKNVTIIFNTIKSNFSMGIFSGYLINSPVSSQPFSKSMFNQ
jgi:tetratricopeptide (TPR) repeat protein